MYPLVSDARTESSSLTVAISYKPEGGASWTTETASYYAADDYFYHDWVIPGGAETGLYDVKVEVWDSDGGYSTKTETREFNVT